MQKIEKLTPYQESQIVPHRDYWLNYILSCKNFTDREQATKGIEWLYKFCKKERPMIFFVDSPFACQLAANYLRILLKDQVGDQVWAQVGDQVGATKLQYYDMSSYGNVGDYGWVSFLDYFLQLDIATSDKKEDFNSFKKLLLSGVFDMIQLEGLCIVSDMPVSIQRNATKQLHSVQAEAVTFKDGYGQHYINGRYISSKMFHEIKSKQLTTESFFKEKNEDIKAAAIAMMQELYGEEYVFRFFQERLSEVDSYVDKKDEKYLIGTTNGMNIGVYPLFNGEINNAQVAYVRCYCPSTDRMFFLGVDPSHKKAKDAIASLYRVPRKLKENIKYIQRQGERFSTVFDEEGTKG